MSKGKWRAHDLPDWQHVQSKSQAIRRSFAACGRVGGETAARNMTQEERRARAQRAIQARWAKRDEAAVSRLAENFKPKNFQFFLESCGRLGGETTARSMTPEERSARAKRAVEAREAKRNEKKEVERIGARAPDKPLPG